MQHSVNHFLGSRLIDVIVIREKRIGESENLFYAAIRW